MSKDPALHATRHHASENFAGFLRRLSLRDVGVPRARLPFALGRSAGGQPVPRGAPDLSAFVTRVRLEIRRAARSGRPLSLALLRLDAGHAQETEWTQLWSAIGRRKRETDIGAHVGHHTAAVLLLDTDEAGAQVFAREMLRHLSPLRVSSIAQAYPGHLFDNLARDDSTL